MVSVGANHNQTIYDIQIWNILLTKFSKMINLKIFSKFENNNLKYQIYMESKYAKYPYKLIEKNLICLDLIHVETCDILMPFAMEKSIHNFY